ncbi:MAG TPA: ATP-binding protein [Opitutaceae bacterium]
MADDAARAAELREIVNGLHDVVFRCDARGRWTFLNPAWQEQLGWPVSPCLGRDAIRFVHRADRRQLAADWTLLRSAAEVTLRREVRFRTADRGTRWMLVSARARHDAAGTWQGAVGTLTDVTAAKALQAQLLAARAAAEAANRTKSEFFATMSHELRTPLNSVIGLSESLLESGAPFDPERTRRYLAIIFSSGRQLLAHINDLLDLARLDAGRMTLAAEPFDARSICSAALESAQRDLRAKRLTVALQLPPRPVMVTADERRLQQALHHLVGNAIKFSHEAGRIALTLEQLESGAVRIAVSDTGIGIPPDKLERLFEPAYQVDATLARRFGGTGLGLTLVDRIVRLHHGGVAVRSAPGEGSTFTIELPASVSRLPAPAADAPSPRRVVLVDDDPNQHTLVGDYLRRHGFEVRRCDNAAAALAAIPAVNPGLVIVDIALPDMSGLELIARLRSTPGGRDVPILAATALAGADDAERCRQAGATAHLSKPISLQALAERIHRLTGAVL